MDYFASGLLLGVLLLAVGQNAQPDKPAPSGGSTTADFAPLPEDPKEATALAERLNGLDQSGSKAWHVRASYEIYDNDGDNVDSGVYDEVWAGPTQYRRSYSGPEFKQTDYASSKGLYRSGNQEWPKSMIASVRRLIVVPMDYVYVERESVLRRVPRSFGQANLVCIVQKPLHASMLHPVGVPETETNRQNCFDPAKSLLRIALHPGLSESAVWNNVVLFQGSFVAKDIKFSQFGKTRIAIHVETLETATVDDATFAPPAEATGPMQGPIRGEAGMTRVLSQTYPEYPEAAKRAHIQGKVTVEAWIGKDGSVVGTTALDGPVELRKAALETVQKWKFEPVLLLGTPVEMILKIEIQFNLA